MIIEIILFIFCAFVARLFFTLAKKYNRYLFLYPLFGVLCFLISYFTFSILSVAIFSLAFNSLYHANEIVTSCFTIPFAIIISGIYYKFLENKFRKLARKTNINYIGKQ